MDSGFGSLSELERANSESLRDVEESDIVGDGADDGDDFGIVFSLSCGDGWVVFSEVFDDAWDRDGVSVESGLIESFVDYLIELGISSSLEEGVELSVGGCTLMSDLR